MGRIPNSLENLKRTNLETKKMSRLVTIASKTCAKRNFAAAAVATSTSTGNAGWYPDFQPTHIESEYRSNLWVATLPISSDSLDSSCSSPTVTIKDRIVRITSGRFDNKEIKLPIDSMEETIMARFDRNKLVISVELENKLNYGTPIPINRL